MARAPRFDAVWNRRRSARITWRRWRSWALVAGLFALAILARALPENDSARWQTVDHSFRLCAERGSGPCVIDGDTLAIGQRRIRLTGYDAPELEGACRAEIAQAIRARSEALSWLEAGAFEWDGGSDPPRDRYGRELRAARRGNGTLAEHMIGKGLAEGSGWSDRPIDWCG